jgi:hypothetical protein
VHNRTFCLIPRQKGARRGGHSRVSFRFPPTCCGIDARTITITSCVVVEGTFNVFKVLRWRVSPQRCEGIGVFFGSIGSSGLNFLRGH